MLGFKKKEGEVKTGQLSTITPSKPSQTVGVVAVSSSTTPERFSGSTSGAKTFQRIPNDFIREEWIERQLRARIKEFTDEKKLIVFVGTWNVNGKKCGEDLSSWLSVEPTPDIYAIGFQEIVDLNAGSLLVDHNAVEPWEQKIEKTLKGHHTKVASKHLVGICLCIYVKTKLFDHVSDVQFDTAGVGVLGRGGNKGAVVIRFKIYDSTMCFVSSHLAAHQNNVAGRNSDYHTIIRRVKFFEKIKTPQLLGATQLLQATPGAPGTILPLTSGTGPAMVSSVGIGGVTSGVSVTTSTTGGSTVTPAGTVSGAPVGYSNITYSILDHDQVFWFGDLNYRLNLTDLNLVYSKIESKEWKYLLACDQLVREKAAGNAFENFREGVIDFPPTYKYLPGTGKYDKRETGKKRMPAWTDRIQSMGDDMKQLQYKRAELTTSDHKPVMGLFAVQAQMVVAEKKLKVYQSLGRQLDAWENENIPKVALSCKEVCFPKTAFDTPVTKKLRIDNTGKVKVVFHFIPKLEEQNFCKPWLHVSPEFGIIPPNKSQDVSITVHVTRPTAHALNSDQDELEDILIFRLENGRDYFVTITGDYLKSCFGASLQHLVKSPAPVRFADRTKISTKDQSKVLSMPKELWRIVDYLFRNGMDEPNLFTAPGDLGEIEKIRECLDTGQDFGTAFSIHSMAETLIRFLENLHQPVFPASLVEKYTEGINLTAWCKQALMQLTPEHYNVFIYITSFLREVLKHGDKNKLTSVQLVLPFSACLMHADLQLQSGKGKPKPWVILRHFLTTKEL